MNACGFYISVNGRIPMLLNAQIHPSVEVYVYVEMDDWEKLGNEEMCGIVAGDKTY